MKISLLLVPICLIVSCNQEPKTSPSNKDYVQILIEEGNTTPTVDIPNFTLISNNPEAERADAIAIMKVKRQWPLAMQKKDEAIFESILAQNFSFRADDEFFNRSDYIKDRVAGTFEIDTVRYENFALQFFGEIALLTYRNTLDGADEKGLPDIEHYSWADIYTKENGVWKILGSHCIEARVEYPTLSTTLK